MAPIVVERSVSCAAQPHALWCVITDTERLNRAVGLGPIELVANDDESAARYLVRTIAGGFPLEYEERPFEWVENESFSVRRVVRRGAAAWMENRFALAGGTDGTNVTVRVAIEPRYRLLGPIIRLQASRFVDKLARALLRLDDDLAAGREGAFQSAAGRLDREALAAASERLLARVGDDQRSAAEKLVAAVESFSDVALDRIRPLELAARWDLEPRAVLGACLHAVVAGLLELRWDLVCPSCLTATDRLSSLRDVSQDGHCQLCDIGFSVSLDRSVEATFRPARAIRVLDEGPYCIGGPARTPHVVAQAILPPDEAVELRAPTAAGSLRAFVRGGTEARIAVVDGAPAEVALEVTEDDTDLGDHTVAPGGTIRVRQRGGSERHVKLERIDWNELAATASLVATLPEFRQMFSSEALRSDITLRIGRVTLLFTDLTASTELYRRVGDARAFTIVQDHFDLIERVVGEHHGAVVKTIGDAVMAVFDRERDGLAATAALQAAWPAFCETHQEIEGCALKIGVHSGPCYAVQANGILDYFGQTVNLAARLQAEAAAREIVLAEEVWERWRDHAPEATAEPFEASLKGIGALPAIRLRLR
jgi:adenylate cyclase